MVADAAKPLPLLKGETGVGVQGCEDRSDVCSVAAVIAAACRSRLRPAGERVNALVAANVCHALCSTYDRIVH
jgi:hypothetical protein